MKTGFDVQVGDGDFFWETNGSLQFPEMAGNVDVQLKQYTEVKISQACTQSYWCTQLNLYVYSSLHGKSTYFSAY